MDTLPPELILGIVKHLPRSDLPSVRAVCRNTAGFATALLFRKVRVSLNRKDLVKLQSIARAPNLHNLVEELNLNTYKLQDHGLISFHAIRNHNGNRCPPIVDEYHFVCSSVEQSMQELELFWKYRDAFKDQQYLERSGTDQRTLSEAFNLLKNVRTVSTNDLGDSDELASEYPNNRYLFLQQKSTYGQPLTRSCHHPLLKFMRALSDSSVKPRSLKLGTRGIHDVAFDFRLLSQTICGAFNPSSEFDWQGSLCSLRDMELQGVCWGSDGVRSDATISTFRNLMHYTPILERLVIQSFSSISVPLSELFDTHTLQHLHHLDLSNFHLTVDDAATFLCRRASTLEDVRLHLVSLSGEVETDRWSSILEKLRTFGFPILKTFALEHCYDKQDIFDLTAKGYIRCESDANPCLAYETEIETETETETESENGQ